VLEITAYHEAGHVWTALHYGAQVLRVTIEPDWDDGPLRYGDTQVAWPVDQMGQQEFQRRSVLVALAGPVAEMIHLGQPNEVLAVAEWRADWLVAWTAAAPLAPAHAPRLGLLERCSTELFQLLNADAHWQQLATIVDHLLAHETLDEDMINDIIVGE
jgi:ATP-dependent Zn protease